MNIETRILTATLLLFFGSIYAQTHDEADIEKLRSEIKKIEKNLHEQTNREKKTIHTVEELDKQISLNKNLVSKLNSKIEKQKKRRIDLEDERQTLSNRLERVQDIFAKRMISLYKHGKVGTLELLLNAKNVNQVLLWAEYQRRLANMDARLITSIKTRKAKLDSTEVQVARVISEQNKALEERLSGQKQLEDSRKSKGELLKKIRQDKSTYQQQVADYKAAIERIQKIIRESEEKRLREEQEQQHNITGEPELSSKIPGQPFSALKGNLPWPVAGEIIRNYGPYRHPVLKTVTENIGVDIKASLGSEVRCVADGRVTAITWQRGRGNLIIVNHTDGYYTVYTHVDEISVRLQEDITAGTVLGVVGEAGIDKYPLIHFQVWKGFNHLNPETWLAN
ncbi:MAG: peptidoglycan DD-metalloendopeptidase family protein [Deferribacteres bacterium]|nr:peptidoglycan DD-metalloendopeptidase family protein [candidate division KSB1 bacterium]MCB9502767.1 peptidoglycan DD-metalloendopeptidase family protein [Deferribacteres bacterium]